MLRFRHKTLVAVVGLTWLSIGVFLLRLGLSFLVESGSRQHNPLPLLDLLAKRIGTFEHASIFVIAFGLALGFFKGRFVLSRSVHRIVKRIQSFPEPMPITKIYNFSYYVLVSSMILLGVLIKYFDVPYDIRGLIDVAVGAALINGAMLYFRQVPKMG